MRTRDIHVGETYLVYAPRAKGENFSADGCSRQR